MNSLRLLLLGWFIPLIGLAGESALTMTYQPLSGLGSGRVIVVPVACHHWYAHSGASAVDLIGLKNVPPTDNAEQATFDLNLASVIGLRFGTNDLGAVGSEPMILLDASELIANDPYEHPRAEVVRASLECLRRCLPEQLLKTPVTLKCKPDDKEWLSKLVDEFNSHPRSKPFFRKAT